MVFSDKLIEDLGVVRTQGLFLEGKKVVPEFEELQNTREKHVICAVDGGSAPILLTPSLVVLFVRVAKIFFEPKKVVRKQGFVCSFVEEKNNSAFIKTIFYPEDNKKPEEIFSCPLTELGEQPTLFSAANLARKILEWRAVNEEKEIITLWDGSLSVTNVVEERERPRNNCVGIAKSTGTMGDWSLFHKEGLWAAKVTQESFFVKLHKQSKHVLRADTHDKKLLEVLVPWSCDPVFLGYPYPLIVADEIARVSNAEASGMRVRLQGLLKEKWSNVSFGMQDAHSILDSIKY